MMDTVPGPFDSSFCILWRMKDSTHFIFSHKTLYYSCINNTFYLEGSAHWTFPNFQKYYPSSYLRQNILFLLLPPTNFEQDWVLYTAICFHIMKKKTIGLAELNRQWELYFFTHLFSSTGLWCLLVLGLQFNINEICMLYLLVSNPCILSSGYNVSVKNTTLHLIS